MKYILLLLFVVLHLSTFSQVRRNQHKEIHTYKISTNISRPMLDIQGFPNYSSWLLNFNYISSGRVFSIEPEIQLSDEFSIAVPVYFGVNRMDVNNYDETLYTSWNYVDSLTIPSLAYIQTNYNRSLDMIGQIGAQGKWFPWGHEISSKSKFYPFISAGFHTALYDIYTMDFGQTWDPEAIAEFGPGSYRKGQNVDVLEARSHKTIVLRAELLLGVELLFGEHFGLTYSLGYSTRRHYVNQASDRLYTRGDEGEAYVLLAEFGFPGEDILQIDMRRIPVHRLQLTYAFGSK